MEIFALLAAIFLMAFLVESAVEYIFGVLFEHVAALKAHSWALMYIALAVALVGAWWYQFDMLYLLTKWLGYALGITPVGVILTGCLIGRGSNAVHDAIVKFFRRDVVKVDG